MFDLIVCPRVSALHPGSKPGNDPRSRVAEFETVADGCGVVDEEGVSLCLAAEAEEEEQIRRDVDADVGAGAGAGAGLERRRERKELDLVMLVGHCIAFGYGR